MIKEGVEGTLFENNDLSQTVQTSSYLTQELLAAINLQAEGWKRDGQSIHYNGRDIIDDLKSLVSVNNEYLKHSIDLLEEIRTLKLKNIQLAEEVAEGRRYKKNLQECEKVLSRREDTLEELRKSKSYRVGRAIVEALKKPGLSTLILPLTVVKIALKK